MEKTLEGVGVAAERPVKGFSVAQVKNEMMAVEMQRREGLKDSGYGE